MLRISALLLLIPVCIASCCYRRPTSAQSDRFDTHHPRVPVVVCPSCGDLRNRSEHFLWAEARGTSNRWMIGGESGYNFNHARIFADAGTRWWPDGNLTWAHRQQIGIVPFNPNWLLHPEIGIGLHQRYFRCTIFLMCDPPHRPEPEFYWQSFAGIRYAVPNSNVVMVMRAYRLQNFYTQRADWNFGIQLSFRL
jgi:hypothetical protein